MTDEICSRCGSPRRVSKTWTETVETMSGSVTTLKMMQTVCTNEACQAEFEQKRVIEIQRQEEAKQKKIEHELERKKNMIAGRKAKKTE